MTFASPVPLVVCLFSSLHSLFNNNAHVFFCCCSVIDKKCRPRVKIIKIQLFRRFFIHKTTLRVLQNFIHDLQNIKKSSTVHDYFPFTLKIQTQVIEVQSESAFNKLKFSLKPAIFSYSSKIYINFAIIESIKVQSSNGTFHSIPRR